MINPIQLIQMFRNPQGAISEIIRINPTLKNNQPLMQAINAMENGNPQEAEMIARNVCKQNGTTAEDVITKFKGMAGQ